MFSSTPILSRPLESSKLGTGARRGGSTQESRLICCPFCLTGSSTEAGAGAVSFSPKVAGLEKRLDLCRSDRCAILPFFSAPHAQTA